MYKLLQIAERCLNHPPHMDKLLEFWNRGSLVSDLIDVQRKRRVRNGQVRTMDNSIV